MFIWTTFSDEIVATMVRLRFSFTSATEYPPKYYGMNVLFWRSNWNALRETRREGNYVYVRLVMMERHFGGFIVLHKS